MSLSYPFFATDQEVTAIWNWIADIPGMVLLESSSRPDLPLRTFDRFQEVDWPEPEQFTSLVAWPSPISSAPIKSQIVFSEEGRRLNGGNGRTILTSPAFLRIGRVSAPRLNHIAFKSLIFESKASSKGKFTDEQVDGVDWNAFGRLVRDIKREVQKSAAGKWRSIPVSHEIAKTLQNEERRLWFWGHEGTL